MSEARTVFFAGGGTGGHLYPGIAVAEALRAVVPEIQPIFLCTERDIDQTILKPTGFEFIPQPIVPPSRMRPYISRWSPSMDMVALSPNEGMGALVNA
jgi:UDP-N-acetylglucosamine:LPS N-acetylglucosamine transferase